MILIPNFVAPSRIEGVGIFTAEALAAGTLIWRLDPKLDRMLSKEELASLSPVGREFAERYGYPYPHDPDQLIIELDNGRFMNHATAPNTDFTNPDAGYTRHAIAAGEELTCNYSEFDPSFEILPGRNFVSVG
jgi:SET domain-containing protein